MARRTVAIVSDAAGYGGSQVYLTQLVSHLRDTWRFVALVSERAAEETVRRLTDAGAELLTVADMRRAPRPRVVLRIVHALREVDPALVHVGLTDQGDGLGPLLAARLAHRRTVASLHLVIPERARWRERISTRALRLPDLVIGVSESVADYARHAGARTAVVLNGIDEPDFVGEPHAALGLAPDKLVVGGIGRIDHQKGWDVLCRAVTLVRRELPNVVFVVIGEGPELKEFRRMQACADVRFVGYRERASSLIRAFDVLVVPSRYEAFGRVAAEAMFAGVPVIASNVDGLPEVVGECGVLIPPERPDLLASAIAEFLIDPASRKKHAECAKTRAISAFSAKRMADETQQAYLALESSEPSGRKTRRRKAPVTPK